MPTRFMAVVVLAFACLAGMPMKTLADELEDVTRIYRGGNASEATRRADTYLAQNPRDPRMRFFKGVMLMEQNQSAAAQTLFEQLTQDYPELPEPYNNLAVLYAAQGNYGKARVALETVVRTNPNYALVYENLGDVYLQLAAQSFGNAQQLGGSATAPATARKLAAIKELLPAAAAGAQKND